MMNIVKVRRFKDNAERLYQLPEGHFVDRGVIVKVEYADGLTAHGVTTTRTFYGDGVEDLIFELFNIKPGTELKRVIEVSTSAPVYWGMAPEDIPDDLPDEEG